MKSGCVTCLLFLAGGLFGPALLRADELAEAQALIAADRLPEAREPLERLVASRPDDLDARLTLAGVYHGLGRREEGMRLLEPVLETHADDARVLGIYAGQCLLQAGELGMGFRALVLARRGREMMERAVALAPNEISYREALVDFYRQAPGFAGGSMAKARAHAEAITRIDPVRGGAWLAALLIDEGRHEEALAACDAALAARPDDYVALFTLGKTVSESGLRLADGEAALRRCLEMRPSASEPSHAGVWHRLGLIAELSGDLEAARAAQRRALELEPHFTRPAEALRRLERAGLLSGSD
jgi:tetratricopeptide (TPR) repeat protein